MFLKSVVDNEKNRPVPFVCSKSARGQYPEPEKRTDHPGFEETRPLRDDRRTLARERPRRKTAQVSFADLKASSSRSSSVRAHGLAPRPAKPVFLHLGRQAEIVCGNTVIGTAGMVHPAVLNKFRNQLQKTGIFEADLNKVEKARKTQVTFKRSAARCSPPATFRWKSTRRRPRIHSRKDQWLQGEEPRLRGTQSIYQGDKIAAGKNMVYTFVYQSPDATLTDDEVNKAHNKLRA